MVTLITTALKWHPSKTTTATTLRYRYIHKCVWVSGLVLVLYIDLKMSPVLYCLCTSSSTCDLTGVLISAGKGLKPLVVFQLSFLIRLTLSHTLYALSHVEFYLWLSYCYSHIHRHITVLCNFSVSCQEMSYGGKKQAKWCQLFWSTLTYFPYILQSFVLHHTTETVLLFLSGFNWLLTDCCWLA